MSSVEKILKKVEQERAKGNYEKALNRLKEAVADSPRTFVFAREAAELAFEMGRVIEGVSILRSAMRRCPQERRHALELAQLEFDTGGQLEVGELLYDAYLAEPDYEQARLIVMALRKDDLEKLLSKLQTKTESIRETLPGEVAKLVGLRLAKSLVLSALERSEDVAATLERVLDSDANQTQVVGRLAKLELIANNRCLPVRLLLARCYLIVDEADLATEQLLAIAREADLRRRALELVGKDVTHPSLLQTRGLMELLEGDFEEAHDTLRTLLEASPQSYATVRQVLDEVEGAAHASESLRQLYATCLAHTNQVGRAVQELEEARETGADSEVTIQTVDQLLQDDPKNLDLLQLRAQLSLDANDPQTAAAFLRQVLESDLQRAKELRAQLEKSFRETLDVQMGLLLVDLLVDMEEPADAAKLLLSLRDLENVKAAELFERSSAIAAKFGFSADLLMLFVETAIHEQRQTDARAAVAHYFNSPGTRIDDVAHQLYVMLSTRPELVEDLADVFKGVPLGAELQLVFAQSRLTGSDPAAGARELEAIVAQSPEHQGKALEFLESHLRQHGDQSMLLELAATFLLESERAVAAAEYLARAIHADPSSTDRVMKRSEHLLSGNAGNDAVWRPLILALIDQKRLRHARELCYRASQSLPKERLGFVHVADGFMQLESGQPAEATQSFERALQSEVVHHERIIDGLEQIIQLDGNNGHSRFTFAKALLLQGDRIDEALAQIGEAVRLDQILVDPGLELLNEHRSAFGDTVEARVLEGTLQLKKGNKQSGIQILSEAIQQSPGVPDAVLTALQVEWDRNAEDFTTGLAFARALRKGGQNLRACRLFADLARRFTAHQDVCLNELETALGSEEDLDARKVLIEIYLDRQEEPRAIEHLQRWVELQKNDPSAVRQLLEKVQARLPANAWVVCSLADTHILNGNAVRAEELLRGLIEKDPTQWESTLKTLQAYSAEGEAPSLDLSILELDCYLFGSQWAQAHAALSTLHRNFPETLEKIVDRYATLVEKGATRLAADLDYAHLLQELGRIEVACEVLERALEKSVNLQPRDSELLKREHEIRLSLAAMYADVGREDESKGLLAAILDGSGEEKQTFELLRDLTSRSLSGKIKRVEASLKSTPGDWRARLELARLSLVNGDLGKAREALTFSGESAIVEATRRYLLARSYADDDQPHLAAAVMRAIDLEDVADDDVRRQVMYLQANCTEQLGQYGEAHAWYLRLLSEAPGYKDTHEKARSTYRKHLETALQPRALVLEKRTSLDWT